MDVFTKVQLLPVLIYLLIVLVLLILLLKCVIEMLNIMDAPIMINFKYVKYKILGKLKIVINMLTIKFNVKLIIEHPINVIITKMMDPVLMIHALITLTKMLAMLLVELKILLLVVNIHLDLVIILNSSTVIVLI